MFPRMFFLALICAVLMSRAQSRISIVVASHLIGIFLGRDSTNFFNKKQSPPPPVKEFAFRYAENSLNESSSFSLAAATPNVYTILYAFPILFAAVQAVSSALSPCLSLCLALSLFGAVLGSSRPIVTNGKQSVEDVHCKRFQLGILFYI